VSLNVIRSKNDPLHVQWVGRRDQTKKDRIIPVYTSFVSLVSLRICHENKSPGFKSLSGKGLVLNHLFVQLCIGLYVYSSISL
jgi:hypothetical protein